jgi:Protein of unknown function (DUF3987)
LPLQSGTHNTLAPRTMPLSSTAQRLWIGFYNHIEQQVGATGQLEAVRGLANKMPEHAARIAGVLSIVRDIGAGEVAAQEMEAGIELAQHYASEALRLFGASRVSHQIRDAQRLLAWLHQTWGKPTVSLPDIYQRGPNFLREAAPARRAAEVLVEHGWLIAITAGDLIQVKGRRELWWISRG